MAMEINAAFHWGKFDLISKEDAAKLDLRDILGDETVLKNPMYDRAFDKVLKLFKPKYRISFASLCTGKRPYYKSAKWKKYKTTFSGVDFLVTSNGGLFPEPFWEDFATLTYNSMARSKSEARNRNNLKPHQIPNVEWPEENGTLFEGRTSVLDLDGVNKLYQKKLFERLLRFYRTMDYDYVFGDFVNTQRNYEPFIEAMEILKKEKSIIDYDMPNVDIRDRCSALGFGKPHGVGKMFPTLHSLWMKETVEKIDRFHDLVGTVDEEDGLDSW